MLGPTSHKYGPINTDFAISPRSIFFVTTYFSDYILVPSRSRRTVTNALEQRGFVFSRSADAFVSQLSPSSPTLPRHTHSRHHSSSSSSAETPPPTTPPPQNVPELQTRTFARLRRSGITPAVDRTIRLLSCAGNKDAQWDAKLEGQLRDDLLQVLLATCPATATDEEERYGERDVEDGFQPPELATRFLSLTLTDTEPISVLLEHRLLETLGRTLLGSRGEEDVLVPVGLDLRELPLEATGIVCGVAGRLARKDGKGVGGNGENSPDGEIVEVSFLSTARAGTVIVRECEVERVLRALQEGMEGDRNGNDNGNG